MGRYVADAEAHAPGDTVHIMHSKRDCSGSACPGDFDGCSSVASDIHSRHICK